MKFSFKYFLLLCAMPLQLLAQKNLFETIDVDVRTRTRESAGKVKINPYKPFPTRILNADALLAVKNSFSKYGGDKSKKYQATGFFRTEKINDRWWIIDPDGYRTLHLAFNTIHLGKSGTKDSYKQKFGSKEMWMGKTAEQFRTLHFNGAGSWSDTKAIIEYNKDAKQPLAYTINLSLMSGYGKQRGGTYQKPGHTGYEGGVIFVFDPEFPTYADEAAKQVTAYKDDPNLLGYFSDNEMPLDLESLENYLKLPEDNPGFIAAKKWLDSKGISKEEITDKHREEFLGVVADKYFSIAAKAIKKYDPNHLYLGSRFYGPGKNIAELFKAAGKYVDVISVNYYGAWTPSEELMNNWAAWSGKPFIITEYYVKAEDSGLTNTSGAGWSVRTQEDRGHWYQNWALALMQNKNCLGWHWHRYMDNEPVMKDGKLRMEDVNKGIVDKDFNLYTPLAEKMKQLNERRFQLIKHFDSKSL